MYNYCIYTLSKYTSGMLRIVGGKACYVCVLCEDAYAFGVDVGVFVFAQISRKFIRSDH